MQDKFNSTEDIFQYPICNNCKHHIEGLKCKAFDRIPDYIIEGDDDHSEIIEGQTGDFVFQSI